MRFGPNYAMLINISLPFFSFSVSVGCFCIKTVPESSRKKSIFSQFIVKINVFLSASRSAGNSLSKRMFFPPLKQYRHQFSNGIDNEYIKEVVNLTLLLSRSVLLFRFRFASPNSKVSPRSVILWRYLNVSQRSTFFLLFRRRNLAVCSEGGRDHDKVNKDNRLGWGISFESFCRNRKAFGSAENWNATWREKKFTTNKHKLSRIASTWRTSCSQIWRHCSRCSER